MYNAAQYVGTISKIYRTIPEFMANCLRATLHAKTFSNLFLQGIMGIFFRFFSIFSISDNCHFKNSDFQICLEKISGNFRIRYIFQIQTKSELDTFFRFRHIFQNQTHFSVFQIHFRQKWVNQTDFIFISIPYYRYILEVIYRKVMNYISLIYTYQFWHMRTVFSDEFRHSVKSLVLIIDQLMHCLRMHVLFQFIMVF